MKCILFPSIIFLTGLVAARAELSQPTPLPVTPVTLQAVWSKTPVALDGKLDDSIWKSAPSYPLAFSQTTATTQSGPQDTGSVQFAWDEEFFYAAFSFRDEDVVQESDKDQEHLYLTGDLAELFLKPEDGTWYWELYAAPNGAKTAFFFPGRGRLGLPSGFKYQSGLRTSATFDGTLNDWKDRDTGWTAEMAIPRKELAQAGIPLDPAHPWRIFVGRYNYSRYLPFKELSMMPSLSVENYHLYEEWAHLELVKSVKP